MAAWETGLNQFFSFQSKLTNLSIDCCNFTFVQTNNRQRATWNELQQKYNHLASEYISRNITRSLKPCLLLRGCFFSTIYSASWN